MMRLADLVRCIPEARAQGADVDVARVVADSRQVREGDLFVAVSGLTVDGHDYLEQAARAGASAFVVQDEARLPAGASGASVPDSRIALARMASRIHGDPSSRFALIGVTGTNGKTTTTYLIESIVRSAGGRPGVIGTVGYRFDKEARAAPHTTPDPVDLQALFEEMRAAGTTHVAMEVSSHALDQHRVDGCHFQVAAFTNLTQDHLDYHGSMDAYLEAKQRLFTELLPASDAPNPMAVISADDPHGAALVAATTTPRWTYGVHANADVRATAIHLSASGISCRIESPQGSFDLSSPLVGSFNLENLLCATAVALALGIDGETVAAGLASCTGAPGRLERVPAPDGIGVFVDYAHTPDALDRVLEAVSRLTDQRLIVVFGCGGDRDRTKRPLMGAVVARQADLSVVTSDNPRTEDPDSIIEMILPGLEAESVRRMADSREALAPGARGYAVEPDRRAAIRLAISAARPGDNVVIAGKGHEDYQILGTRRIHFDDREEARAALENKR